jgi:hypothetical protein
VTADKMGLEDVEGIRSEEMQLIQVCDLIIPRL